MQNWELLHVRETLFWACGGIQEVKKAIERGQGSLGLKLLVPQLKVQALSWNGK